MEEVRESQRNKGKSKEQGKVKGTRESQRTKRKSEEQEKFRESKSKAEE